MFITESMINHCMLQQAIFTDTFTCEIISISEILKQTKYAVELMEGLMVGLVEGLMEGLVEGFVAGLIAGPVAGP